MVVVANKHVRYKIARMENNKITGYISFADDYRCDYAIDTTNAQTQYFFEMEIDAIKVAEFKNWYAQLHSLQDIEFKVLKEEVVITEIPIEKVDYLKDRPTVEIEDDTHKANPLITPDNKEGQGKSENDEVTIE